VCEIVVNGLWVNALANSKWLSGGIKDKICYLIDKIELDLAILEGDLLIKRTLLVIKDL